MVTLLYPQASGIGMARDGGGERMAEIDFFFFNQSALGFMVLYE